MAHGAGLRRTPLGDIVGEPKEKKLHHQEIVEMEVKKRRGLCCWKGIPFYFAKIACAQEGSRFAQKRSTLQWR